MSQTASEIRRTMNLTPNLYSDDDQFYAIKEVQLALSYPGMRWFKADFLR